MDTDRQRKGLASTSKRRCDTLIPMPTPKKTAMTRRRLFVTLGIALAVLIGLAIADFARRLAAPSLAMRNQARLGMPESEVLTLFGRPPDEHTDFAQPGPKAPRGEVAYRVSWTDGEATFVAEFGSDRKVVGTEWFPPRATPVQRLLWRLGC
jgi:hypothetical protein